VIFSITRKKEVESILEELKKRIDNIVEVLKSCCSDDADARALTHVLNHHLDNLKVAVERKEKDNQLILECYASLIYALDKSLSYVTRTTPDSKDVLGELMRNSNIIPNVMDGKKLAAELVTKVLK